MNPLAPIGRTVLGFLAAAGRLVLFAAMAVMHCILPPLYPRLVLRQILEIGYFSLPVVGLTAVFTGMVLALQSYTGFSRFEAESAIAGIVVLSVTRELGPVLAGLMVAGRIGAAIAAELATGEGRVAVVVGFAEQGSAGRSAVEPNAAADGRGGDLANVLGV